MDTVKTNELYCAIVALLPALTNLCSGDEVHQIKRAMSSTNLDATSGPEDNEQPMYARILAIANVAFIFATEADRLALAQELMNGEKRIFTCVQT